MFCVSCTIIANIYTKWTRLVGIMSWCRISLLCDTVIKTWLLYHQGWKHVCPPPGPDRNWRNILHITTYITCTDITSGAVGSLNIRGFSFNLIKDSCSNGSKRNRVEFPIMYWYKNLSQHDYIINIKHCWFRYESTQVSMMVRNSIGPG